MREGIPEVEIESGYEPHSPTPLDRYGSIRAFADVLIPRMWKHDASVPLQPQILVDIMHRKWDVKSKTLDVA